MKYVIPFLGLVLAGIFVLPMHPADASPSQHVAVQHASLSTKATCSTVVLTGSQHVAEVKKTQYRKGPFAGLVIFFARANDGYTFAATGTAFLAVHEHVKNC